MCVSVCVYIYIYVCVCIYDMYLNNKIVCVVYPMVYSLVTKLCMLFTLLYIYFNNKTS